LDEGEVYGKTGSQKLAAKTPNPVTAILVGRLWGSRRKIDDAD
jgi:hypothetical protein